MIVGIVLCIFFIVLILIVWNKIPRSIVAMVGALLLVLIGEYSHFLTQEEALQAIDFNTIGLLMGMMILVAIIKKTGFLTYIAIKSAKASQGNLFSLMIILGFATAFLSMLIDNVTTLVIIGPTTILIADILGVSAIPFLITEVIFSNIGGVGTLIGDPPNIMIASAAGFTFNDFLVHLFPLVIIVLIILTFFIKIIFRRELKMSGDNFEAVLAMDERKAISDHKGVRGSLFSLGVVLVMLIFPTFFPFEPAFIALFGGSLALILVRPDPDEVFRDVEWDILFFFAALFVLVRAVEQTGLFIVITEGITHLAKMHFSWCAVLLMWCASFFSTFIGSIAFTAAAIPVIKEVPLLPEQTETLWWALAVGAGFGGNALPISSAAGVVCISILKRSERPLSMKTWIKTASVLTLISLVIATLIFLLFGRIFF
ncbi:MAG: ArsB/NhaD family transporter [Candidatus Omnitrophica bacterium]|nr:ArsB/NhaD family transporter [Candidatus Omnitrophota bacterium]